MLYKTVKLHMLLVSLFHIILLPFASVVGTCSSLHTDGTKH